MNARSAAVAVVAGLAGLIVASAFDQSSSAEHVATPAASGPYQIVVKPTSDTLSTVFVFDSHTGRCWHRSTFPDETKWHDLGSPLIK